MARILPVDRIAKQLGVPDKVFFGRIALSPDGRWLAARDPGGHVLLFPADGGSARFLPAPPGGGATVLAFSPNGDQLVTAGPGQSLRFLSLPDLREIRNVELGGVQSWGLVRGGRLLTFTRMSRDDARP